MIRQLLLALLTAVSMCSLLMLMVGTLELNRATAITIAALYLGVGAAVASMTYRPSGGPMTWGDLAFVMVSYPLLLIRGIFRRLSQ